MKTATTCVRTDKGWELLHGPDVNADKQRKDFHRIGHKWPEGVLAVRFHMDGLKARTWDRSKAETVATRFKIANQMADEQAKKAEQAANESAKAKKHKSEPAAK